MRVFASTLLLLALAACASKAAPAKPAAPPNKCAFVADHLLSLLTATAKEAPADQLDQVRAMFNKRCTEDAWSAAAQDCFLALTAKEQVDTCASKLTQAQSEALNHPTSPDEAKRTSAQ